MTRLDASSPAGDRVRPDATTSCTHCGLPVPADLIDGDGGEQFCCDGCRTVYAVIHACGLDRYYALREAAGASGQPARAVDDRYEALDDPVCAERLVTTTASGLERIVFHLEGVHCGACVWLVERLPHVVDGVAESRLEFGRSVVQVVYDPAIARRSVIARRLASLGYPPHPIASGELDMARKIEDRRSMIRIAVAGAIAGNVMLIAFALYGRLFHGMEAEYATLFRWVSLGLTTIALLWPGSVFFRGALAALRARTVNVDVPVSIGLAAGGIGSAINTITGRGEVYFDSVTVLVFLLLVGRWVQQRQQRRTADAVALLFTLTPRTARLVEGDTVREVPLERLERGAIVEVRAGDSVPVDGVVTEGRSSLDRAVLTGESTPVTVVAGDHVHAGTTNLADRIRVRAEATGADTRIARLMQLVEDGARRRAPVVQLADRIAGIFVLVIVCLAAATYLLWLAIEPARAMPNAIALLIITCPCALGLATPLAIVAAIGRAARRNILIKGGDVFERLRRPGLLLLDKTGTVTRGRLAVAAWHGPDELRARVAAVESHSAHPIARAIAEAFESADLPAAHDVVERTGAGVAGTVDGAAIVVGSRRLMTARRIDVPAWAADVEAEVARDALTPVFAAVDGVVHGVVALGDPLEPDAAEAIAAMQDAGWRVGLVSGDDPRVVDVVARRLGIDPDQCRGAVNPEEKLDLVEREKVNAPVLMVGDGVNDAAALAAATVGVAVRGGAEASLAAADVYVNRAGLGALPLLDAGAHRTLHVIRRNLLVSLAYNVAGTTLAMAGLVNPLVAAILMPISSLTVIMLSYRSRTF